MRVICNKAGCDPSECDECEHSEEHEPIEEFEGEFCHELVDNCAAAGEIDLNKEGSERVICIQIETTEDKVDDILEGELFYV
jgi:hypothetical protein